MNAQANHAMNTKQRKWAWVGITGLFIAAVIVLAIIARSHKQAQPMSSPEITISMDAQGRAKIGGVTIGNTNVRDAALSVMDKLNVKPKIVVPNTMTNAQQASNFVDLLNSAARAGLLRDKEPNPYE